MKCPIGLVVMFSCTIVLAQSAVRDSVPDAPSAAIANRNTLLSFATIPVLDLRLANSSAIAMPMIEYVAPQPALKHTPRLFDKRMIGSLILSSALTAADVELTSSCLHARTCTEANPLYGRDPSRAKLYGISLPILGGQAAFSAWLKHRSPDSKAWMIPMISGTAAHGVGALTAISK